jgi:hypothetical protein
MNKKEYFEKILDRSTEELELLMKFYNCLIKSFQSRHKIIDKSLYIRERKSSIYTA